MRFRTEISCKERFCCPSGSSTKIDYIRETKSDGTCFLKKTGTTNLKFLIQESSKGHLLCDLIKRARIGDTSAIPAVDPSAFGDCTNIPQDLMAAQNLQVKVNTLFDSLPADTRDKFGNNPYKFLKAVSDNSQDIVNCVAASESAKVASSKLSSEQILTNVINKIIGGKSNE